MQERLMDLYDEFTKQIDTEKFKALSMTFMALRWRNLTKLDGAMTGKEVTDFVSMLKDLRKNINDGVQ